MVNKKPDTKNPIATLPGTKQSSSNQANIRQVLPAHYHSGKQQNPWLNENLEWTLILA